MEIGRNTLKNIKDFVFGSWISVDLGSFDNKIEKVQKNESSRNQKNLERKMKKQKTVAEKQNQTNTRQTGSIVWAKEWSVRICSFAHSRITIEAENLKKESYEDSNCVCVSVYIPIFDMYSIQTDNEQCGRQRILLSLHLE